MTEGKAGRLILEFAIPLLLGSSFEEFHSLADKSAIVGKFLGVDELAAVGSTGSINCFDYRVLYGNLQRFCDSDCAEVWSKGRERNAALCSQQCMGICDLCSGAHNRDGASVQKYPAVDADTGKYHRRCMDVYRHHFRGNSCDKLSTI